MPANYQMTVSYFGVLKAGFYNQHKRGNKMKDFLLSTVTLLIFGITLFMIALRAVS